MKMKQFKALTKKEIIINYKTLLIPIWFILGIYAYQAISLLIAWFKHDLDFSMNISAMNLDAKFFDNINNFSFLVNYIMFVLPAIMAGLSMVSLTQKALNENIKLKCEFFHRSQPVDESLIILSKLTVMVGGAWLVANIIGMINFFVTNSVLQNYISIDWYSATSGFLCSSLMFLITYIFIGSLLILVSVIFKKNALLKLVLGGSVLQVMTIVVNKLYGWNIPLILNFIFKPLFHPFSSFSKSAFKNYTLVKDAWDMLFSTNSFILVFSSVVMLFFAYLIYKNSEIQS